MSIRDFVKEIIKGTGGFNDFESREFVVFHHSREEGIADFVIRCLANIHCKGSDEVLAAIVEKRLIDFQNNLLKDDTDSFYGCMVENARLLSIQAETKERGNASELFLHLSEEHGVNLIDSELDEIKRIVLKSE